MVSNTRRDGSQTASFDFAKHNFIQMLVVGRPGSGCTTFMRAVANKRNSFVGVKGDVNYGTLTSEEALDYRQQIIYNSEGILSRFRGGNSSQTTPY
jgi:ABC-type multidrug transport system ATPase subunit